MSVLLAEDNKMNQQLASKMLQDSEFEVKKRREETRREENTREVEEKKMRREEMGREEKK